MAVLKGGEIDRFLKAPDSARPIILIYGPDSGLVGERARMLAKAAVPDLNDPFSVVRLEGDSLASDPARLADEAGIVAMFAARRLIWVKAGDKSFAAAVTPLLAAPPADAIVLIEAGDLKKNAPLRVEAERSAKAAVIPCYSDGEADIRRLVSDEVAQAGMVIDPDAASLLVAHLGGDRLASRAEIQKVCLYAHGKERISAEDVEAIAGDSMALGIDEIIDAAAGGEPAILDRLLVRADASGVAAPQIMSRHGPPPRIAPQGKGRSRERLIRRDGRRSVRAAAILPQEGTGSAPAEPLVRRAPGAHDGACCRSHIRDPYQGGSCNSHRQSHADGDRDERQGDEALNLSR